MGAGKNWTAKEIEYLEESLGYESIATIAQNLGRTVNAINIKRFKLGLGPALLNGDYVTLNALFVWFFNADNVDSYKLKSWVKNRGMPVHKKRVNECSFREVYIDEFWKWAEKNRNFIDFSKTVPGALGEEPDWVIEQRHKDFDKNQRYKKTPWTADEDDKLLWLLKKQKYTYTQIAKEMHRTEGAILRRCNDIGTPYRPVRIAPHDSKWSDEDFKILADGIKGGEGYAAIAERIGKSEKAVRGKVYTKYFTEDADRVRNMMQGGTEWGFGAPIPTVKQGRHLNGYKAEIKNNLSLFAGILKYRMNELGYDPYWQRFMCVNWDDFDGCSAGGTCCDECTDFVRIRPQYCRRCGGEFYERKSNEFCNDCRAARKKAAQKKYAILNKRGRI